MVQKTYGETEAGIMFLTFLEYTTMFNGKAEEVKNLIIQAFGIDIRNKQAMMY